MIPPLLDPNQIPLVRATERRTSDPSPRAFEKAVAHSPAAATPATDPIELDLRDEHGSTRTISLPWGLAATPRLSQSEAGAALQTQLFLLLQPGAALTGTADTAPVTHGVPVAPGPFMALATSVRPTAGMAIVATREPAQTPSLATAASAAAQHPDAGVPWQERWLQWLRGSGGDVQLRLRDYRLDETNHPQLLQQLHRFARDQGMALTRVTVNGHELWRMPEPATGNHHGR
ncbi:hypothetical protein PDM28_18315 [Stenotrophomonas aracearum]|jgi:hypothetical protein|uniref:Toxin co-regulated pilus biosynthesis protein Q C-terminal domain-containing protein n=1 Tax=Stenotrophomonas aracearum TaxID=3003272 RepID=A0ABY9YCK6_9GAMM|nr:hypothetical protein [Stenotrophomonas sp. A5588]WNH48587.1 hypothetical protein PDM28_18315 [Stenotrophomonas sp. A5588]